MQVAKDTVVSLTYELFDADGKQIEKTDAPIEYLHGGYDGIFPLVEQALAGKSAGETCRVRLEPDDAFGEYDADLVHLEPRRQVSRQHRGRHAVRGARHGVRAPTLIYTVTNIADDKVVVDGNHPLCRQGAGFHLHRHRRARGDAGRTRPTGTCMGRMATITDVSRLRA